MDLLPRKGITDDEIGGQVARIIELATLEEKIAMMSGHGFFEQIRESGGRLSAHPYRAGGGCERLTVPALYFTDGPRGVARGNSTCFPCTMARGAAFDVDLERRIGEVMGIEARAQGCNFSGAVCVNLLRHPAWGRAQETYGEDPWHLGEMGAALATGIQAHNVVATVKHFALNSIENARFKIDVRIDPRTLREVYLPHFKRILDAGCASVMSAYNKMNGEYCGQNRELLTDILRGEWGFDGFVHSDWVLGVYRAYAAAAGLDVENPEPIHFGAELLAAVKSGAIEPQVIDTACRRILTTLYRFASAEDPLDNYSIDLVASPAHRAIAHEAALKSAVMLKNHGALPFDKIEVRLVAVAGRLAIIANTGDNGSSRVWPPYVVTALDGLKDYLGDAKVVFAGDEGDSDAAAETAKAADAAVVVVGYTARDEGEFIPGDMSGDVRVEVPQKSIGGDRDNLGLSPDQIALIKTIAAANPRTVVIVIAGSPVLMNEWIDDVPAVMQTFYAGMEGGRALAKLLFGEVSPSGKLPFTVPASASDLPFFDRDAESIEYGPYHGYTLLEKSGIRPAFAFGYGQSYARFGYRALKARRSRAGIVVSVSVINLGEVAADEIVQIYVGFPGRMVDRPKKLLRGFKRVSLIPGETATLRFEVPLDSLRWYDASAKSWRLEPGTHTIYAGSSSRDDDLLRREITL
ncbi:MAG: glycoside hydrolase family 3 C-terminal domain-containing protein [Candidatus Binatus sp.]|uniref:beta-glucosidase family protein n=1 Tax=Candidatus Binatus sp. TaxID=2811406 RepID=UPI0027219A78|nr:glycoside hydrolase family 3 C-terminal domain-containing protein [Candidatus Binatus sp.]MDO8434086.1 glycoside hydrolase family 3 C-terminal domain-containing protein [Candidatus Binatus sp.]